MVAKSESIKELSAALAKAQAEIKGAAKDSANPYFKSRYADLASVWDACREPLTKNGLAVSQWPSAEGPKVTVETILSHESGEWISRELTITAKEDSPQAVGSALTYARRYALAAVAGVAPEDDDGEAAQGRGGKLAAAHKALEATAEQPTNGIKNDRVQELIKMFNECQDEIALNAIGEIVAADMKAKKFTKANFDYLCSIGRQKRQQLEAMDAMNKRFAESGVSE
jgi:hypothetical protein